MKTRHLYWFDNNSNNSIANAINDALCETGGNGQFLRIVNCGRAVVILNDSNREQDCGQEELMEALGLTKKCNDLHSEQNKSRFNYMIEFSDGAIEYVALTEDQVRFLDWLCEKNAFWDDLTYHLIDPKSFEEV